MNTVQDSWLGGLQKHWYPYEGNTKLKSLEKRLVFCNLVPRKNTTHMSEGRPHTKIVGKCVLELNHFEPRNPFQIILLSDCCLFFVFAFGFCFGLDRFDSNESS